MSIYKKLFEAKKEIGKISKDSTNPFYKSKYFDINQLLEHVEPILQKHDLLCLQPILNGCVSSIIIDIETGEKEISSLELTNQTDPQKRGSEITYYRRYTLGSLLGLQAEDDDANSTVGNNSKYNSKRTITEWLTEEQFNKAIQSDKVGITATINAYSKGSKGMKKDYLTQLTQKLKTL
tara:strand:+ start:469 stop:1005 length:537 start_codon:yes stop_codon:yes gene_type:complete